MTNQNLTIDHLRQAMEFMRKPDALEQQGIPKDWVCVLHPRLYGALRDHFKVKDIDNNTMIGMLYNPIERITGRKTFIINSAPDDRVEYMPEETMNLKYAEYFISLAKLRLMEENESED